MLRNAGIEFQVQAAQVEEVVSGPWAPRELCMINAKRKAVEVARRFPDRLVLGADTVVALEGSIFGKPADLREARGMLERLCGRTHEVLTGVCLIQKSRRKLCSFIESTRVKFRARQDVDLEDYLRTVQALDKAGGYAAQEDEGRLIEQVEGSMSNIIGLPLDRVLAALDRHF